MPGVERREPTRKIRRDLSALRSRSSSEQPRSSSIADRSADGAASPALGAEHEQPPVVADFCPTFWPPPESLVRRIASPIERRARWIFWPVGKISRSLIPIEQTRAGNRPCHAELLTPRGTDPRSSECRPLGGDNNGGELCDHRQNRPGSIENLLDFGYVLLHRVHGLSRLFE